MAITLYYVVVASGSAAPSAAQIAAGHDSTNAAALAAGNQAYTATGIIDFATLVSGRAASTIYDTYVTAYDLTSYSTPAKGSITTAAAGLSPGAAVFTLAGHPPTVGQPHTVSPGVAALNVAGHAPTVAQPRSLTPGVATLTLAGHAPSIAQPRSLSPGVAALTLTGHAPTVTRASTISPGAAVLVLTGHTPTISQPRTISPGAAVLTLSGHAPTISGSVQTVVGAPDYGDKPRKRRYVQKVGDRLMVFTDPVEAIKALEGQKTAAPAQKIKIAEIKAVAKVYKQEQKIAQLFNQRDYDQMVAVYEAILQQQDDDDIEMLLLSL